MAIVRPFRAYRPPVSVVGRVASPPYDVINTAEARQLAHGNPNSFLHVSRPEIDLPEGTNEHADVVYEQGAKNLKKLLEARDLVADDQPHLYLYAQQMASHRQVGLVACASVQEYVDDRIKKHEKTRQDKEDDRTRHIDTLGAHDEPVFLTYRAMPAIDEAVAAVTKNAPVYDFTSADQVRHTLWIVDVDNSARIAKLFDAVPFLYVADGHHRSASAARVHAKRAGSPGEHDVFLAVIFPHDQMQIMAYNRVVMDPKSRSAEELLAEFRKRFDVSPTDQPVPDRPRTFSLFLGGAWYRLVTRPGSFHEDDPVGSLDASICQDQILAPMFDIHDPRRDKKVDFVGGIRGHEELERRVSDGGWTLALHLYPTGIEQLMTVSDAGMLMPPKSTWFEPKLRSGLFLHVF